MLAHLLLNDALSGIDLIVIWLNIMGSTLAAWWNLKSAKVSPAPWHGIRLSIGALSVLYAIAYVILATTDVRQAQWASVMRGVALMAWWFVWIVPAKLSVPVWHKINKIAEENDLVEIEDVMSAFEERPEE